MSDATYQPKVYKDQGGDRLVVADGGSIELESGGSLSGAQLRYTARSRVFDLDNGAGTTIDHTIMVPAVDITIVAARIVYSGATTGTVAGANAKLGTTVAGAEIVAATAYENTKAVGTKTNMTIVSGAVPAGSPVICRHTGIAATAAGEAHVEIDYTIDS